MTVVHKSKFHTLYQSDRDRCFHIDFGPKIVKLSFCQLLALRQKILSISIEDHYSSDLNKHGFEILMLCNKEHLFLLNTYEILDLRQLISNGFISLGLASEEAALTV
ncbi:MAG: hypothetical protein V7724_08905 [Sediminicola sp.]